MVPTTVEMRGSLSVVVTGKVEALIKEVSGPCEVQGGSPQSTI